MPKGMFISYQTFASILLAVIQGITEWFPISSSGHLILAQKILHYDGGFFFDVALHFGTLLAVLVYFGKDIVEIVRDLLRGRWKSPNGKLGLLLIVATIPAAVAGFLFRDVVAASFDSLGVVAIGFAITGIALFIATLYHPKHQISLEKMGVREAALIGCAQVFALLPGISRSGSTLAIGILAGLSIRDAAKFSFLMSIPIVFGANILVIGNNALPTSLIGATLVSFVVGLITLHLLYKYAFASTDRLRWFATYALLLALALGTWLLWHR